MTDDERGCVWLLALVVFVGFMIKTCIHCGNPTLRGRECGGSTAGPGPSTGGGASDCYMCGSLCSSYEDDDLAEACLDDCRRTCGRR